jgi:pyruvate dehydrogenase phosphatase
MIMCSDGLLDLYEDKDFDLHEMVPIWSDIVVSGKQRDAKQNLALLLLRESIGGQDLEKISQTMTVELCFRWMDDTTILVQRL